ELVRRRGVGLLEREGPLDLTLDRLVRERGEALAQVLDGVADPPRSRRIAPTKADVAGLNLVEARLADGVVVSAVFDALQPSGVAELPERRDDGGERLLVRLACPDDNRGAAGAGGGDEPPRLGEIPLVRA